MGTATSPLPPPAAAADAARAGLRAVGTGPPPATTVAGADSGTHSVTAEPLAVDLHGGGPLDERRRAVLASAAAAFGASTPLRSRRSSTHLVEWVACWKSGWRRMARSAGMVVATPSTTISSSARMARAMATGRSRPQTMSLPIRLS